MRTWELSHFDRDFHTPCEPAPVAMVWIVRMAPTRASRGATGCLWENPRPAVGLVQEFCAYCAKEFASAVARYSRRTDQRSAAHAPRTLLPWRPSTPGSIPAAVPHVLHHQQEDAPRGIPDLRDPGATSTPMLRNHLTLGSGRVTSISSGVPHRGGRSSSRRTLTGVPGRYQLHQRGSLPQSPAIASGSPSEQCPMNGWSVFC